MNDFEIPSVWTDHVERELLSDSLLVSMFYEVKDFTWRERLFSWPWRPWRKRGLVPKDEFAGAPMKIPDWKFDE